MPTSEKSFTRKWVPFSLLWSYQFVGLLVMREARHVTLYNFSHAHARPKLFTHFRKFSSVSLQSLKRAREEEWVDGEGGWSVKILIFSATLSDISHVILEAKILLHIESTKPRCHEHCIDTYITCSHYYYHRTHHIIFFYSSFIPSFFFVFHLSRLLFIYLGKSLRPWILCASRFSFIFYSVLT